MKCLPEQKSQACKQLLMLLLVCLHPACSGVSHQEIHIVKSLSKISTLCLGGMSSHQANDTRQPAVMLPRWTRGSAVEAGGMVMVVNGQENDGTDLCRYCTGLQGAICRDT